ncbi:MAG: YidC/Oxa1 family membrane protein insertase [Candidatus Kerfeldbacteria bacterium]|nr:YidC/Oxa1 family membrane protein insertase [Candidatus Kerfeldbacteria bacterium]
MFNFIWYEILYKPLYNLLITMYVISPPYKEIGGGDMGLAVIFLTILIRIVLLPFSIRSARSEHRLERLQPVFDEIKSKYRYNLERQRIATRQLLRQNNIGIFSNLFSLLFQILFFVVLYKIFSSGLQPGGHNTFYPITPRPKIIDPYFLGKLNLIVPSQAASLVAAFVIFFQQAIRRVKHISEASVIDKVLLFGLPLGIYFATIVLPASKALFITTSVIFSLWMRLIRGIVLKYVVKDEKLKENIKDLWTS